MKPPFGSTLENLFSGYFAAVMATGIVSIALLLARAKLFSLWFMDLALLLYVTMFLLYFTRAIVYPVAVRRDLIDARTAFNYFTFVAGTDVVGTRLAFASHYVWATILGIVGAASWLILIYFVVMTVTVHNTRPEEQVINGGWLIATVGAESVTVLAAVVAPQWPAVSEAILFAAYMFWAVGILLYLIFIAIILHRFFYYPIKASDLQPSYWINMGAVAITTLAGSRLSADISLAPFLATIDPFVEGVTIMLWAWGTWWIPFLLLIGIWKYLIQRERFTYHPSLWSVVFPLGMYTAATNVFGTVYRLPFLAAIPIFSLWVALAAWTIVAVAFLWQWRRRDAASVSSGNSL